MHQASINRTIRHDSPQVEISCNNHPSITMLALKRFFTSEAGPSKPDPAGTAIRLIRGLLEKHERLSTPQIWEKGTEGFKPILQPVQEYNENGDIKMKIVSNMREGRRVWVPPPVLPMPHHPFQSVK